MRWMMVIVIALGVGCGKKKNDPALARPCQALLENLEQATRMYYTDFGAYPPSGSANLARSLKVQGAKKLAYYEFLEGSLNAQGEILDPWDRPVRYRNNVAENAAQADRSKWTGRNKMGFDLWSLGADGIEGNEDDVTNWEGK
jgi:hypothetical protein